MWVVGVLRGDSAQSGLTKIRYVLRLQWAEYGYIPSALPDAKCFGEGAQVSLPGLH